MNHTTESAIRRGECRVVRALPACSFGVALHNARYEFRATTGKWAFGCEYHYHAHRMYSALGIGLAKLVILEHEEFDRIGEVTIRLTRAQAGALKTLADSVTMLDTASRETWGEFCNACAALTAAIIEFDRPGEAPDSALTR